jgi:hypothetical protein
MQQQSSSQSYRSIILHCHSYLRNLFLRDLYLTIDIKMKLYVLSFQSGPRYRVVSYFFRVVLRSQGTLIHLIFRQYYSALTELSPSWGAINLATTQELPSILRNPKVQYRIHKSPPLVAILSHINPIQSNAIHSIPSYLSKIHFNIVHSPTPWSSQLSLSFWLSCQYPILVSL